MPTITIFPYEEIREYEEELERLRLFEEFEKIKKGKKEFEIKVVERLKLQATFNLKKLANQAKSFISSELRLKSVKTAEESKACWFCF